jgi:ubiquinone/menaquinone biosynthesis C-methylase UbiE
MNNELRENDDAMDCSACGWTRPISGGVVDLREDISADESRQTEIYDEIQKGQDQTSDPMKSFITPGGYRYTRTLNWLPIKEGQKFIEIGGAAGPLTDSIASNKGATGIAVDISPQSVSAQLNRRGSRSHYDAIAASANKLPFADETFDAAVAFDLMEHLEQPDKFLEEAWRVLKPGGALVLRGQVMDFGCTIDWLAYHFRHEKWMQHCHEIGHHYKNFRTKRQWKHMAAEVGFKVVRSQGYDIFWDNLIEYYLLPMLVRMKTTGKAVLQQDSEAGTLLRVPQSSKHKLARLANRIFWYFLLPERLLGKLGLGASLCLALEKKARK